MVKQLQQNQTNKVIAKEEIHPDGTKTASLSAQYYSAPIPPPEMMEHYDKIVPGSADRIIRKFESQTEHRQKCESIFIWTESIKSIGGLVAGFIIAMTAIIGGIFLSIKGKTGLGGSISFAGLSLLVGAFITDKFRKNKKKPEEEKPN
jgi:uncharacterized membrane protein